MEAESIAYIVCNHFGLDTSEYSFTYIASWCESRDMKALKASMDTIRKTSAEIIGNIEEQMHELERENTMQYEEKEAFATRQEKLEQDSAEKIDELCFFMEKAVVLQSIRWIRVESTLISLWVLNQLKN